MEQNMLMVAQLQRNVWSTYTQICHFSSALKALLHSLALDSILIPFRSAISLLCSPSLFCMELHLVLQLRV